MSGLAASSWRSIDTSTNLVRDKIERNDGVLDPFCLFTASSGNLKAHCSVHALTFTTYVVNSLLTGFLDIPLS